MLPQIIVVKKWIIRSVLKRDYSDSYTAQKNLCKAIELYT